LGGDIRKSCKSFCRERTGREHVLVMPYILRESAERLRSLVLFDILLSKSRRSSIVLFCPILEFGAFAQEDGITPNHQSFGMLGERE